MSQTMPLSLEVLREQIRDVASNLAKHVEDCMAQRREVDRRREEYRREQLAALERLSSKMDRAFWAIAVAGIGALGYLTVFWVQHTP